MKNDIQIGCMRVSLMDGSQVLDLQQDPLRTRGMAEAHLYQARSRASATTEWAFNALRSTRRRHAGGVEARLARPRSAPPPRTTG